MLKLLISGFISLFSFQSLASPLYSLCQSEDQAVHIELLSQNLTAEDNLNVDLRIVVKRGSGANEKTFPTVERIQDDRVIYTLLDSDLEILGIERATGRGRVWRGLPGGLNPYVFVNCQSN
jgi:hypothetical protein